MTHDDFELASANSTPQKQNASKLVKQLHAELDTPPGEVKHGRVRQRAQVANKITTNLFTTEVSPDGIAGLFNETVSPFKSNYKSVTSMMKGSLNEDICREHHSQLSERPATSPEPMHKAKHIIASTPERKASKVSRPKPFIKKKPSVSHIGNTMIQQNDLDKVNQSSPVPSAPVIGKFRKKLSLCLSPLAETPNELKPSPSPEEALQPSDGRNSCISPLTKGVTADFSDEQPHSGISTLSDYIEEMEIFEKRSPRSRHASSMGDVDIIIDIDGDDDRSTKKVLPSRPSMPPSKNGRPKPNKKKQSEDRDSVKSSRKIDDKIDLMAEGQAFTMLRQNVLKEQIKSTDMQIQRMKFVPMPRRKLHKVEKLKFNPRLEHIVENEEVHHTVPRWLTIFRKKRNELGHGKSANKRPTPGHSMENNCDNSLLSSTILLISDGVQMDGVDPLEEHQCCIPKVDFSSLSDHGHDDEQRRKLETYFNPPDGVDQVTDYAGFDCIFNRYGANLKNYVENHKNIVSVVDASGNNLLHAAAYIGWERAVKFLIRRGVSVNHTNIYGATPLAYAIEFENFEIRDYLLKKGAAVAV